MCARIQVVICMHACVYSSANKIENQLSEISILDFDQISCET